MRRIVAVIPARGGSKGIPRKNLRPLAGFPLLDWVLAAAARAESPTLIAVTSDDPAILDHAGVTWGPTDPAGRPLHLIRRPPELAEDRTPDLPVFQHALGVLGIKGFDDLVVHLRPTSPFVLPADIDLAARRLAECWASSLRSVRTPRDHPAKMFRSRPGPDAERYGGSQFDELIPYGADHWPNHPRQGLEPVWAAAGYVDAIRASTIAGGSMAGNLVVRFDAPPDRCVDIDTEADFAGAERLAREHGWRPGHVG